MHELEESRHGSFTNYYDSDGNDLRGGNDEANLWYIYKEGRLKQLMISGHQEREARNMGFRDSQEAALRVHGIVRSKYHKGKWIQNQGGKWVEVHPFGKPDDVSEAANAAQQAAIAIAKKKKKGIDETASAGATSSASIASLPNPSVTGHKHRHKKVKSVSALDQNSVSLFGGPMENIQAPIIKRR